MLTRLGCLILVVILVVSPTLAASDRPLRQAKSANGRFQLRIEATRADRDGQRRGLRGEGAAGREAGGGGAGREGDADDAARPGEGEEIPDWPANAGERGDEGAAEGGDAEAGDAGETDEASPRDGHARGRRGGSRGRERTEARGVEATLVDREARGAARLRWEGRLVNEVSPAQAFVHNDGRWVVTLDDFGVGGAEHAVVVYDEHGHVVREFELEVLLSREDRRHVRERGEALEWLEGAQCRFVAEPERFAIRLRWEREIWIDLESGELSDETEIAAGDDAAWTDALAAAAETEDEDEAGAPEVAAQLMSRLQAEMAAGNEENAAVVQEMLRHLMAEQETAPADEIPDEVKEAIQAALQESIGIELPVGAEVVEGGGGGAPQSTMGAEQTGPALGAPEHAVYTPPGSDEALLLPVAGNSATIGGVPVPQPNPQNPVNYVEWMNQQAATVGPSAAPLLEAAGQAVVNYEGPVELQDAALQGDVSALGSPEVAAWVEANRAAMDQAVAATQLDYRGMPARSDDGMVMGVLLPNLANMRQVAKAMVTDGKRLELLESQPQAAVDRYMQVLEVGAQQSRGPTLIENLVGNAVQRIGSEAMLDSFANAGDALDFERVAQQLEERYKPLRPVAETMQFERVMVLDVVQRAFVYDEASGQYQVNPQGAEMLAMVQGMTSGESNAPFGVVGSMVALNAVGFENTLAQANQHYDQMTVASQVPYHEGKQLFADLERQVEDPLFRAKNPLLATLLPSLSRASALSTQAEATRRATNVVARLKAYRQRNGTYPASLEDVGVGANAIDPFTGLPFAYSTDGADFSLYSVGMDGVDNAGAEWDRGQNSGDLRFWPRPAKK